MMHLRGLVLFTLLLPGIARRCTRLDLLVHHAQQQTNTLTEGVHVSAEMRGALLPGGSRTALFRGRGPQTRTSQLRAEHLEPRLAAPPHRVGPLLATVPMHAVSVPKEDQLPPKVKTDVAPLRALRQVLHGEGRLRHKNLVMATPLSPQEGGSSSHSALLLIDCQKAFLTGSWAQYFGLDQVGPIRQAFANTLSLLQQQDSLSDCAVMCTKCYTEGEEADYDDTLRPLLAGVPCIWKPSTDVTINPKFHEWFQKCLSMGVRTLVIGGCTTTSCVRVSSQSVREAYPDAGLRVVVDLSLCGAREDNYLPNADQHPGLVRIYGLKACTGASAVDLARRQMCANGVEVVDSFDWGENAPGAEQGEPE